MNAHRARPVVIRWHDDVYVCSIVTEERFLENPAVREKQLHLDDTPALILAPLLRHQGALLEMLLTLLVQMLGATAAWARARRHFL